MHGTDTISSAASNLANYDPNDYIIFTILFGCSIIR